MAHVMLDISTKSAPAKVHYGSTSFDVDTQEDSERLVTLGDNEQDSLTKCSTSSVDEHPRLRRLALELSLWINVFVTLAKLVAYIQTSSLSVLAALVDSVLDIVSQLVLNYTEKHSSLQRSSAFYPAGASRLEPVGVLTCAALMGMASFEVIKESIERLAVGDTPFTDSSLASFWSMVGVIVLKLGLLYLCQRAAELKIYSGSGRQTVQLTDPTLEALAQDHWNDALSNGVAAVALLLALQNPHLWWVDPIGAITISLYIIHSWFSTGKEQVEQLTGKAAPSDFLEELEEIANTFDERMMFVALTTLDPNSWWKSKWCSRKTHCSLRVTTWEWNCSMKSNREKKWSVALFILITNQDRMMNMSSVKYRN
jgi:cation diffusion facilitator family transporter